MWLTCQTCDNSFQSSIQFGKHMCLKLQTIERGEENFQCTVCDKNLASKKRLVHNSTPSISIVRFYLIFKFIHSTLQISISQTISLKKCSTKNMHYLRDDIYRWRRFLQSHHVLAWKCLRTFLRAMRQELFNEIASGSSSKNARDPTKWVPAMRKNIRESYRTRNARCHQARAQRSGENAQMPFMW